jgi:hypothetical protein
MVKMLKMENYQACGRIVCCSVKTTKCIKMKKKYLVAQSVHKEFRLIQSKPWNICVHCCEQMGQGCLMFKYISEPNEHTNKCKYNNITKYISTIDHKFLQLVQGLDQKTQMVLSWVFSLVNFA